MVEERLDRIEEMMNKLISTVGLIIEQQTEMRNDQLAMKNDIAIIKEEQASMKNDIATIKEEQASMKEEQASMKEEQASMKEHQNQQHQEIMTKLTTMQADQDLIWEKNSKNERDIGIMKNLLKL